MKLAVHIVHRAYDEARLAELRPLLDRDVAVTAGAELPDPAEYHILVAGRPERAFLTASPNLQVLVIPWAGLPESTWTLMQDFPQIAVHNLHHNAQPVAEHAVALLLAAAKSIVPMDRALRAGDWRPRYEPNPSLLLAGKTALVLGYGAIGRRVARLCKGLGLEVVAIRRREAADEDGIHVAPLAELDVLLPRADALLVCLPHTSETEGLIGARELALLPTQAVLVNIGRGPIVDEAALFEALRQGRLHAAGLDVWYHYPEDEAARLHTAPSAFPFHKLDNVVLSPHRAGHAAETESLRLAHLAGMLNAAARGEPLPNRVDLQAGY